MLKKTRPAWSRVGLLAAAAFLTMSGATAQTAAPAQQRALVLQGGTLIDGTGKAPIPDAVIVVQGTRIAAVGRRGQVQIPANANVINVTGRTILPGLIDTHLHTVDWQLPMFLPYGVTTVADENNDATWILVQRALLKSGKIKGPRMFVAGTAMDGTLQGRVVGQFNTPIAATVEDARAIARSNVAAGVDIVKVLQDITDDQLSAAIAVAKESSLPAMGHTPNIRRAAQLGFKFAEHMWTIGFALLDPEYKTNIGEGGNNDPPPESLADPKTFPSLIDYLVKQGVYVNPPLIGVWSQTSPRAQEIANEGAQLAKDPGLAFVPADQKKAWATIPEKRAGWDNVKEFLGEYAKAGGKVVVGTDTGFDNKKIPGLSEHQEMELFVDVGYTPMQAIQAATLWNAELIKKDKDLGSVEPGKLADFVIVEGNPLANISATKNIRMVIKDGAVVDTKYDPKWVNPVPAPYSSWQIPSPAIAVSPKRAPQGGQTVTLQIENTTKGLNPVSLFAPNAVVRFDNVDLPTRFVSGTKLTATLDARLLQRSPGSYTLYVVNPGIHGTISRTTYFDVGGGEGKEIDGYAVINGRVMDKPSFNRGTRSDEQTVFFSKSLYQINGLSPRLAPQGSKTITLQINGLKFAPNSIVRFDNTELPTRFVSSTKLTATLDAQLLQRQPGSYVLYVVSPGPLGQVSQPAYFLVNLKQ